ncbi:MAG: epoxyqueuosine reductase QueH [Patescibacteria group bacterium]|jgi:predicted adenine nucleotide alpha hydrolase (AANH) superfamily ATPase/VanZ family protein
MRKRLIIFITLCWLAAMATLLFYPTVYIPHAVEKITYYDKVAHLVMYGVLTYLFLAIGIRWKRQKFFWIFLTVFSLSTIANFSAEYLQAFIPGRDPSFLDFLAGLVGIALAVPIAYFIHYTPKRKTLLHVCCAPCATAVREFLAHNCHLEFFFYNPNVHPRQEYLKRLDEVKKLATKFGIKVHAKKYNRTAWKKAIAGHESEPEGGSRCKLCFQHRLCVAAKMAKEKNIPFFATTLTISPHKNSLIINKLGEKIGLWLGVNFLNANFKKNGGFQRSIELSKKFRLYRQKYCGCEYSKNNANKI